MLETAAWWATWYAALGYLLLAVLEAIAAAHLRRHYTTRARASLYIAWMLVGDATYSAIHGVVILALFDTIVEHFAVGIVVVALAHTPPLLCSSAWVLYVLGLKNGDTQH